MSSNESSLLEQNVDDSIVCTDGFDLYVSIVSLFLVMRFSQSSLGIADIMSNLVR